MSVKLPWHRRFPKPLIVVLASLLVSGAIAGVRHLGLLEDLELWAYDNFIQLRSQDRPDSRLVLIAIDDRAIQKLNSDKISDLDLTKTLQTLSQYQPRVIGVDILRDVPIGVGREELLKYLNKTYDPLAGKIKPIILSCQLPSKENPDGIAPPKVLDLDSSIGFVDVIADRSDMIHRVMITSIPTPTKEAANPSPETTTQGEKGSKSLCQVPFSLGFLVAMGYLQKDNITVVQNSEGFFKLGSVIFKPPAQRSGGYQNLNPQDYQIILDYRLRNPIKTISLADVLEGKLKPEDIKNKAVLLGYTTKEDIHRTPYGIIPGVFIHAQVITQILSNVLDNRPQIWTLAEPVEWLWIVVWGVAGGTVAWRFRAPWLFSLGEITLLGLLVGTTFFLFTQEGWIPVIPPLLSLALAAVVVKSLPRSLLQEDFPIPETVVEGQISSRLSPQETVVEGQISSRLSPQETVVEGQIPSRLSPQETVVEGQISSRLSPQETVVEGQISSRLSPQETVVEGQIYHPSASGNTQIEEQTVAQLSDHSSEPDLVDSMVVPQKEYVRANPYIGVLLGEGGRYRTEKHLGGGGMGQVYLASDTRLPGRKIAVKLLTTYVSGDNQHLIQRFEREVAMMATLKSTNIVEISDFGLASADSPFRGAPFYVMEYLKGQTLTERIEAKGHLSLKEAIPILRQICEGLREAHHQKIAHRDLKPDNIFLTPVGSLELVKILDFGIAKIIDEGQDQQRKATLTAMGGFIGTYRYASPEQCLGDKKIDQRTDIYSLGVVFYEMLTGTNPYNIREHQDTQGYWISSHIGKTPQPLRSQPGCENLPPQLEVVVMKCLSKSPGDRFTDIDELEEAIRQAIPEYFGN